MYSAASSRTPLGGSRRTLEAAGDAVATAVEDDAADLVDEPDARNGLIDLVRLAELPSELTTVPSDLADLLPATVSVASPTVRSAPPQRQTYPRPATSPIAVRHPRLWSIPLGVLVVGSSLASTAVAASAFWHARQHRAALAVVPNGDAGRAAQADRWAEQASRLSDVALWLLVVTAVVTAAWAAAAVANLTRDQATRWRNVARTIGWAVPLVGPACAIYAVSSATARARGRGAHGLWAALVVATIPLVLCAQGAAFVGERTTTIDAALDRLSFEQVVYAVLALVGLVVTLLASRAVVVTEQVARELADS